MQTIAEINELTVAFQNPKKTIIALDKVSFTLNPGETLVLLGESGCGKSLTSLALMRLLPRFAVYGENSQIIVHGNDILNLPENKMRELRGKKMAMIFQEPMAALNPVLTIGEQIAEVIKRHHFAIPSDIQGMVLSLLNEVEMPHPDLRIHQYPHQLSGGQKQRVVIAMALACKPDVLIADEPTTALDVTIQAQILALLKKLQTARQMSMLLITHDLGVAQVMADHLCVMYAGQVVEKASKNDFFNQVGHPYVQQLLASLPSFSKRNEKLPIISGSVPTLESMPKGCRFHARCIYAFDRCFHEEPQLQTINNRILRCHLYPEIKELPPLNNKTALWEKSDVQGKVILRVNELSVHFEHRKRFMSPTTPPFKAVDQLSFSLSEGKTLALVGESGCGKTTASRALLRLIPVAGGEVYYKDQNILSLVGIELRRYRKKVQIIFQDPFSSLNPRMTVEDLISEGMLAQGMKRDCIKKNLKMLIDQVNLPLNSLDRYPHQFSGGQRQRICIARALATEPEVLICDEPTSALDISVQAQILNLLKELQKERNISYLFITHNMGVVSYVADDVLVMKDGKRVEFGPCETILNHPQHPYTKQLLNAVLEVE
ncbi:ABC transporter ATP-binding protein [Legionella waltersii]|uniref:ABC-type dipeptide transporter n=1 Tax=Legionella waltersii TaxID=66969 RepID=A0A0W1A096_9GAMM|nr:ABC transporter ATP-binding protein [Legionella waltersii]KTD74765.1 ABC dipeptide/oligopeptide/nickel transport, ATPase component [Legionella waltersii]SNV00328.1 ABC dipeptide/oligopeptide/nickel transport, ATPase component [Legionella waltersii]